jgi:hypothetical protein
MLVPKTLEANLLWRQEIRRLVRKDPRLAPGILGLCKKSFLFWCNAFAWTYQQKRVKRDGTEVKVMGPVAHVPFITWQIQDEVAGKVISAIENGGDLNIEKSRDMGATWLLLTIIDWYFLFYSEFNAGAVSRKENLVDAAGDMDCLFEKIRYIHNHLPAWMLPQIRSRYMHLVNEELSSTIAGESTNANVGRGGRKTVYLIDEAAAVRNGMDIEHSISQNTASQIWVSTPLGPNTQFHKRIKEGRGQRIQMPWWRHPDKARGAYQILDPLGHVHWTSRWYQRLPERFSRKLIAQEVDMSHGQSGDMFFDFMELERHRKDHQTEPKFLGDLILTEPMTEREQIEVIESFAVDKLVFVTGHGRKPWRFWVELDEGRPPQNYSYVFGVDISNGSGNSNSIITATAVEIGRVVAKWWDAFTPPEELAMRAALAGIWFGGAVPPAFIVWENNGPGGIFGRKLVKMGYPSFYRQRIDNTIRDRKTPRWGWHSNAQRKEVLLGMYRDALATDKLIQPCEESLDEAGDYIYDTSGLLIPSMMRDEPSGGRMLHGDHVIADALSNLGTEEMPAQHNKEARTPHGSFAWRRARADRSRNTEEQAWSR